MFEITIVHDVRLDEISQQQLFSHLHKVND